MFWSLFLCFSIFLAAMNAVTVGHYWTGIFLIALFAKLFSEFIIKATEQNIRRNMHSNLADKFGRVLERMIENVDIQNNRARKEQEAFLRNMERLLQNNLMDCCKNCKHFEKSVFGAKKEQVSEAELVDK